MRNIYPVLALILLFGCLSQGPSQQSSTLPSAGIPQQPAVAPAPSNPTNAPSAPPSPQGMKYSDSPYASYGVQIAPGPLSDSANRAITGFTLNSSQTANGTTEVTLTEAATGQTTSVEVKPGYALYFIETSYGDDPPNADTSLGDDGLVLVDPNGYIAQ